MDNTKKGSIIKWELDFEGLTNVHTIGIVEEEAIGVGFRFSKEKNEEIDSEEEMAFALMQKMQEADYTFDVPEERFEELRPQRLVAGPMMIADKLIVRFNDSNEPYYGYFDGESIRNTAQNFVASGKTREFNVNHDQNQLLEDVYLVESWLTTGTEEDKSYYYGYNLPKDSWFGIIRVDNEELYNEMIRTGELHGFSVETLVRERVLFDRQKGGS